MFDCRLEVAGHPGRQFEALLVVALYPLVFGLQTCERGVRITSQRWDSHQADEGQRSSGLRLRAEVVDQVGAADVDSAAGSVAIEAELQIDPQRLGPPAFGRALPPTPGPAR